VNKFLKYYEGVETRPVFESVEEMLKWAGLFNLTGKSLKEELVDGVKLAPLLIKELVTVRISFFFYLFFPSLWPIGFEFFL
jgi:prenylcysteine oxidase/farnesylcysteine lyase